MNLWRWLPHRHKWLELGTCKDADGSVQSLRQCLRCYESRFEITFPQGGVTLKPGESLRVEIHPGDDLKAARIAAKAFVTGKMVQEHDPE